MTMAPAPHDPRRPPSAAARNGYTGRNAHGFSATAPASVSGSSDGYPLTAANQYHCPSHPIARSAIVASAPKRETGPEKNGRASCRETEGQYVMTSVVAGQLKNTKSKHYDNN